MRRGAQCGSEHADDDRRDGDMLAPPRMLAEDAPSEVQQDEQSGRKRRLHYYQRNEQQRHELQGPAEHRDAGAHQPACPSEQVESEAEAQMLGVRSPLCVYRLQRDP